MRSSRFSARVYPEEMMPVIENPYLQALKTAYTDLEGAINAYEATIRQQAETIVTLERRVEELEQAQQPAAASAPNSQAVTPPLPVAPMPSPEIIATPPLQRWTEVAPLILSTQTMSILIDDQQRERARAAFEAMKEPPPKSPVAAAAKRVPSPPPAYRANTASWAERLRQTLPQAAPS